MRRWLVLTGAVFIGLGGVSAAQVCHAQSSTETYSYDALGRLVKVQRSGGGNGDVTTQISFDDAGNRTNYAVADGAELAIGNASVVEGGVLSFTVTRSGVTTSAVGVSYTTSSGTAISGSDFNAKSGNVSFASGETSKTITVSTIDDAVTESVETMSVTLSSPTGAAIITAAVGTGTITDNDGNITLTNANLEVLSPHGGTYVCFWLYEPNDYLNYRACLLNGSWETVFEDNWGTKQFYPGYFMNSDYVLEVTAAAYGTGGL